MAYAAKNNLVTNHFSLNVVTCLCISLLEGPASFNYIGLDY